MIDEKSIKSELNIVEQLMGKLGDASKGIKDIAGNIFGLFKKVIIKEKSSLYEVSDEDFISDCADVIEDQFYKHEKCLIINFDVNSRDLAYEIKDRKIDVNSNVFFIDTVSYSKGLGAPPLLNLIPLNKPTDFENIHYYTVMQLEKMKTDKPFIVFVSINNLLKYSDYNEIGVFLRWYYDKLKDDDIPLFFVYKKSGDPMLKSIITRLLENKEIVIEKAVK
jgi:hypothetical protein